MGSGRDRLDQHQGPPLGGGRKRGAFVQGIGTSRGGRTSKIHGLTDAAGRPRILLISPGNTSDVTMVPALIEAAAGRFDALIADRGYDSNAIRAAVKARGAQIVIPSTRTRKTRSPTTTTTIEPATWSNAYGAASRIAVRRYSLRQTRRQLYGRRLLRRHLHLLVPIESGP